jgi:hypothetical protein
MSRRRVLDTAVAGTVATAVLSLATPEVAFARGIKGFNPVEVIKRDGLQGGEI